MAAGQSRRFGSDKRRAQVPGSDRALLETTLLTLCTVQWPMLIALRPGDDGLWTELKESLSLPLGTAVCYPEDAALGLGHTVSYLAMEALDRGCSHALMALGDMPSITAPTLRVLATTLAAQPSSPRRIVRPRHNGVPGHPIGINAPVLDLMTDLAGERGAGQLLRRYHSDTLWLAVDDPGIGQDVDHPQDLQALPGTRRP